MVALVLTVALLIFATVSDGAFSVSRWAPLALFTLALLIAASAVRGRLAIATPAVRVALAAIWGLAAWSMASMLWAQSPGDAFGGACVIVLYAAMVTVPFALPLSAQVLAAVGWALAGGICLIAVYVLLRLLSDGPALYLAGRLNGPIGYRNATALLFAMPVWPCLVAGASRASRRPLRAVALAAAVLCGGLVFLTQSRGILLGLALGGVFVLLAGPDRVRRAWLAVLVVAAVAAGSHWLLAPYHAFDGGHGDVSPHSIVIAARALALLALGAGALGMALALFDQGLRADSAAMTRLRAGARLALAAGVVAVVVAAAVAIGNPASFAREKWNQFRDLNGEVSTSLRYTSVGGQRYDLWRVALKEFSSAPVGGVGMSNYQWGYYRDRATNRNLDDPHSLIFSLLAETGIVGLALLGVFLAAMATVIRTGWRTLDAGGRRSAIAAATVGIVMMGQSAVDWIWLIPGLTAVGLLALAVGAAQAAAPAPAHAGADLVAFAGADAPSTVAPTALASATATPAASAPPGVRRRRRAVGVLMPVALALPLIAVLALFLSNAYINRARSLTAHPASELSAARAAAALDPWSVTPHYLESSALESAGAFAGAHAQLLHALALEPENFATLGVLGDFEARRGHAASARAYYRRALALDPLDLGLQQLAHYGTRS